MNTRHFFCCATDDNGDCLDWFVEAYSVEQAEELWSDAVQAAGMEFGSEPARIWEVPALTGKPSFIHWHNDTPEDGHPFLVPVVGADPDSRLK